MPQTDIRQRTERIVRRVQARQPHFFILEYAQVVLAGGLRGHERIDWTMRRGNESADIDLSAGQSVGFKDAKRLGEIVVMETGGVGPDIHGHVGLLVSVTDM